MYTVCQNYVSIVIMISKKKFSRCIGMAELRYWLTKYKESTFHNIATFHATIPT